MLQAGQTHAELFGLDERDLFKRLRSDQMTPSPTDNRLRINFWYEYDLAQMEHRPMHMARVFAGICSKSYFNDRFMKRPEKVAWMLTPPVDYVVKIKEALDFGIDRLREYLEIDPIVGGRPNVKLMELQAKIVAMLDMREKGAYTQRVEQKNMNLNVTASNEQVVSALLEADHKVLEQKIKELERRERKAANLPDPGTIEVKAEVSDG